MNEIINDIKNLDESKATQSNDIPTKVYYDVYCNYGIHTFSTENFFNLIQNSVFPDSLEKADIWPVYKKHSRKRKIIGL